LGVKIKSLLPVKIGIELQLFRIIISGMPGIGHSVPEVRMTMPELTVNNHKARIEVANYFMLFI